MTRATLIVSLWGAFSLALPTGSQAQTLPNLTPFSNDSGTLQTATNNGAAISMTGAFFQSLGTNGRSCFSCHRPAQGWSISADEVKQRFDDTQGLDPIFRTNDGSNCDHNIDTSTVGGRRRAYSLLISKGLLRVALPIPTGAEFTVTGVSNPYGCGETTTISTYRRPLPSTNLRFISAVMWDGRESTPPSTQKITFSTNPGDLLADLAHQAVDATLGHAQATASPTNAQVQDIVNFEMNLTTAQATDRKAGPLNAAGANGGPVPLLSQLFFIGINDPLGENPFGTPFTSTIFNLFNAWTNADSGRNRSAEYQQQASIARGQALFNTKPISITGVAGLNDDLGLPVIAGTCGTCHDSLNVGNHSVSAPLNIGVGDLDSPLDVSYLPVVTLRNNVTGEIKRTTDPGRALITGKWADVGRMKGPVLRGLASRAPYFHNGSARTLDDAVNFYDRRFNIGLTEREKRDLVAFLNAL